VTRFYDIDAANARLPELREMLTVLRDQRAELIRLRDRVLELHEEQEAGTTHTRGDPTGPDGVAVEGIAIEEEVRLLRLRMQGVIDQMQATVARIDGWSITLRDIESGLIDFPALVNGRQVCLCWRLGEDDVSWWHELEDGFGGRRELSDLG
jgi:hypothetical protein